MVNYRLPAHLNRPVIFLFNIGKVIIFCYFNVFLVSVLLLAIFIASSFKEIESPFTKYKLVKFDN